MITCKNYGVLGTEITCEPDDEYTYIYCSNIVSKGHFFIRVKDGVPTVFAVSKLGAGEWRSEKFDLAKIQNDPLLVKKTVTRPLTILMPSKEQAVNKLRSSLN
jgi:hypothetical protein